MIQLGEAEHRDHGRQQARARPARPRHRRGQRRGLPGRDPDPRADRRPAAATASRSSAGDGAAAGRHDARRRTCRGGASRARDARRVPRGPLLPGAGMGGGAVRAGGRGLERRRLRVSQRQSRHRRIARAGADGVRGVGGPIAPGSAPGDDPRGQQHRLPRAALLALDDSADELLDTDWVLQRVLSARGERMLFEPAAIAAHEHFDRLGDGWDPRDVRNAGDAAPRAQRTLERRSAPAARRARAAGDAGAEDRAAAALAPRPRRSRRTQPAADAAAAAGLRLGRGPRRRPPDDPRPARRFAALEMELLRTGS